MRKTRKEPARQIEQYPTYQGLRVGCKVSWHYYKSHADALEAARVAVHNAEILAGEGFDFGYQAPGHIEQPAEDGEFAGLYSVVIP